MSPLYVLLPEGKPFRFLQKNRCIFMYTCILFKPPMWCTLFLPYNLAIVPSALFPKQSAQSLKTAPHHTCHFIPRAQRALPRTQIQNRLLLFFFCLCFGKVHIKFTIVTFFFFFRAAHMAYGGSQARGLIRATAASLCHSCSCSNARSELSAAYTRAHSNARSLTH